MKLLLERREEISKGFIRERTNYKQFLPASLNTQEEHEKIGRCFQAAILFHPSHPQSNIINASFCALVRLLLTKLRHYFDYSTVTQKIDDTAPLNNKHKQLRAQLNILYFRQKYVIFLDPFSSSGF